MGSFDGCEEGRALGWRDGCDEGWTLGTPEGCAVGWLVEPRLGYDVGCPDGDHGARPRLHHRDRAPEQRSADEIRGEARRQLGDVVDLAADGDGVDLLGLDGEAGRRRRHRRAHRIADHLHLSVSTIEVYRERLKDKLSLDSSATLTRYAVRWCKDHGTP
mgnify:CR=1 FL=1